MAERLRECMIKAGYSGVRELAGAAKLAPSTVSDALSGARTPSWKTVSSLLRACDVPATSGWVRLRDDAKTAEQRWRQTASSEELTPRPALPEIYSIRPPTGDLPPRVRGRDPLLSALGDLRSEAEPHVRVLHGLGGCGKTTIALELARTAGRNGHQVFWVSAHQHERLITGMRVIARELGVPENEVEDAWSGHGSAPDLLWHHLDQARRRWLLVIDNADKPDFLAVADGSPGDGTGWVRASPAGTTVITTRVGNPQVWGNQAELYPVDVLAVDDAADVLIDIAGHAGDHEDARALADRLGGLPLALVSAGRYLARTARGGGLLKRGPGSDRLRITTFDDYRRALGDIGTDLLDQGLDHTPDTTSLERLHRKLVGRTWEMSLDLLDAQGIGHARRLMRLISCFAPSPLPAELIDPLALEGSDATLAALDDPDRALMALVDLHLLNITESGELSAVPEGFPEPPLPCLVAHRLVLEATAFRVRSLRRAEQDAVWRAAAHVLWTAAAPEPEEHPNWDWWQLVTPHVKAAVGVVPDDDPETLARVAEAGLRCFAYLVFASRYDEAVPLAASLLARTSILPDDDPTRLAIRHRHAFTAGPPAPEALEAEYRDILDRQRKVLGPEHPETLITHYNWAVALTHSRDQAAAEVELRWVAKTRVRVLGPTNPYSLISRHAWAESLSALGLDGEAEAEMRSVVADCRRERGDLDHHTIMQRSSLAGFMTAHGHGEQANAEFSDIVEHYGSPALSDGTHFSAYTRHQMAHALDRAKRYADAEVEYRAALEDMSANGLTEQSDYRHLAQWLGKNLRAQERHDDSLAHFEALIADCSDLPNHDAFLLNLRHDYGDGLRRAQRSEEALSVIDDVLTLREGKGEGESLDTMRERHCRAHTLQRLDRSEEALEELRVVSTALVDLLGVESPEARRVMWCHAMALHRAQRLGEALERLEACHSAEVSALGSESYDALVSSRYITETRFRLGLVSAAETLAEVEALLPKLVQQDGQDGKYVAAVLALRSEVEGRQR
ncbi:NB-ARC domain-containing protein [Saccharothrix sp. BKS2]|uniref:NB-ARC domain-containing protein n=1 Tax=Saccharothrix sp. BKS2 TaxID=3064400 RepID=UPI0039EB58A5